MEGINDFQNEIRLICDSPFMGKERTDIINKTFNYYKVLIRSHCLYDFPILIELMGEHDTENNVIFDDDLINAYLMTIRK